MLTKTIAIIEAVVTGVVLAALVVELLSLAWISADSIRGNRVEHTPLGRNTGAMAMRDAKARQLLADLKTAPTSDPAFDQTVIFAVSARYQHMLYQEL